MKEQSKVENKRMVVEDAGESPQKPAQKMVRVKIRPGRAVAEGQPGSIIRVAEAYALHLRVTGYADIVED